MRETVVLLYLCDMQLKHKWTHVKINSYIVPVLMKSEQQCRGMRFHFDLMQIYNPNRSTKPQIYFIYTHQTTKECYIHIHVSKIQTQEFKKN